MIIDRLLCIHLFVYDVTHISSVQGILHRCFSEFVLGTNFMRNLYQRLWIMNKVLRTASQIQRCNLDPLDDLNRDQTAPLHRQNYTILEWFISSEATRFERSENRVSFFPSEARKKASRNSYIKWPSGVFLEDKNSKGQKQRWKTTRFERSENRVYFSNFLSLQLL